MIEANNPSLTSWIKIEENSDFPIQNLPFGIYSTKNKSKRVGIAIGNQIIDLYELANAGLLDSTEVSSDVFGSEFLNPFMELGKETTRKVRNRVSQLMRASNTEIKGHDGLKKKVLDNESDATMHLPVKIGDYTDFYSSKEHATNVGTMFRDPDNALLPNWLYIPVGYHGRASSIITTEQAIVRPKGQQKPKDDEPPTFGPCKLLDFELEMAFITYNGKPLGESIDVDEAEDFMFGMCLFNDWSARDIQKWEYVPLGPFLAKNFASSMSPWIVTMDALEPFRCETPAQNPKPFEYLQYSGKKSFDIKLEMYIQPENGEENCVSKSNYKHMYWNQSQQLAHHSVNGCNIMCGDLMGSGTISGPTPDSYGSMLELSWKGTKPITLSDGSERKFLLDGDTVIERGYCQNESVRVGFGEVRTKILPAN
ncbi:MAG: fumarylacetoacetase [Crocinitomicaceae bacterium]|nr:fumarylacetoacetase [Crocinitomicaceae bacterium]|tara:strand:- start:129316 stop:130587 length:1272 start_codon:yes stop_codon:yes gene_type:complete